MPDDPHAVRLAVLYNLLSRTEAEQRGVTDEEKSAHLADAIDDIRMLIARLEAEGATTRSDKAWLDAADPLANRWMNLE